MTHAKKGEGGGVCDPQVFCTSKNPGFLARWRVRGRPAVRGPAGTGSVGDGVGRRWRRGRGEEAKTCPWPCESPQTPPPLVHRWPPPAPALTLSASLFVRTREGRAAAVRDYTLPLPPPFWNVPHNHPRSLALSLPPPLFLPPPCISLSPSLSWHLSDVWGVVPQERVGLPLQLHHCRHSPLPALASLFHLEASCLQRGVGPVHCRRSPDVVRAVWCRGTAGE